MPAESDHCSRYVVRAARQHQTHSAAGVSVEELDPEIGGARKPVDRTEKGAQAHGQPVMPHFGGSPVPGNLLKITVFAGWKNLNLT